MIEITHIHLNRIAVGLVIFACVLYTIVGFDMVENKNLLIIMALVSLGAFVWCTIELGDRKYTSKAYTLVPYLEKIIVQGNGTEIQRIFVEILNACEAEFTEDNYATLVTFLGENLADVCILGARRRGLFAGESNASADSVGTLLRFAVEHSVVQAGSDPVEEPQIISLDMA
jgi:hypothetical protein